MRTAGSSEVTLNRPYFDVPGLMLNPNPTADVVRQDTSDVGHPA